jgi:hypothetical protein
MYVGVNDKARKITKAYVGVNGVARKIKAGYVGVNGVARKIYSSGIALKSFSSATDEEITAMLNAVRNGTITQQDLVDAGWTVGAERSVSLSAMSATGVGERHSAQTATFVILHGKDFFDLSDGGKNLFVVGMKTVLNNGGYINSSRTNVGGWASSNRRTWCDNVFRNALPSEVKNWFKKFKYKSSNGNKSTAVSTLENYFTLASPGELGMGGYTYYVSAEGTTPFEYYTIADNRRKKSNDGYNKQMYWTRSASTVTADTFCCYDYNYGNPNINSSTANVTDGYRYLSPFGCF